MDEWNNWNGELVSIDDVRDAAKRIDAHIHKTPVLTCSSIDAKASAATSNDAAANTEKGVRFYFKCENMQRMGAFKMRGATNALMRMPEELRRRGVIAHSSGNHAQALSLAGRTLGVSVTIVMPEGSPQCKVDATRDSYGATVIRSKNTLASRESTTQEEIDRNNQVLVHPYNHPYIVAGAGTAALELIEELDQRRHVHLDAIVAPIGGGGFMSGTAVAAKGSSKDIFVYGAEPYNARDAYVSKEADRLIPNTLETTTIADGLRTSLGPVTFAHIRALVDEIVLVSETEIREAQRLLMERAKIVVEPSGAVPLAAMLKLGRSGQLAERGHYQIGIMISGGNLDLDQLFS